MRNYSCDHFHMRASTPVDQNIPISNIEFANSSPVKATETVIKAKNVSKILKTKNKAKRSSKRQASTNKKYVHF